MLGGTLGEPVSFYCLSQELAILANNLAFFGILTDEDFTIVTYEDFTFSSEGQPMPERENMDAMRHAALGEPADLNSFGQRGGKEFIRGIEKEREKVWINAIKSAAMIQCTRMFNLKYCFVIKGIEHELDKVCSSSRYI